MATRSSIEWTETTWNPVTGCSKVSPGCAHCYAETMSRRLAGMARANAEPIGRGRYYLNVIDCQRGRWNGQVELIHEALADPQQWRTPRRIFVNSMSDLFHEQVPLEFIVRVFETMNGCPQHVFQVLTKRSERLAELAPRLPWSSNIWMGVSIENDKYVGRADDLRRTPAVVRFLSLEPLLGPLPSLDLTGIHWVIVGGESGAGARAMEVFWAIDLRDRCIAASIPFFFKQYGTLKNNTDPKDPTAKENGGSSKGGRTLAGRTWDEMPAVDLATTS